MNNTIGFGAPKDFGKHHFYIDIPASGHEPVRLYEDFGFDGDDAQRETIECRLVLDRQLWTKIRDEARRDFNTRLKARKLKTSTWNTGTVKIDRFLGRELCVLGWAAENATPDECLVIAQRWLALRPEERWWLYSKTAAEASLYSQSSHGWRRALYYALSDATDVKLPPKKTRKRKVANDIEMTLPLFNDVEKGNI